MDIELYDSKDISDFERRLKAIYKDVKNPDRELGLEPMHYLLPLAIFSQCPDFDIVYAETKGMKDVPIHKFVRRFLTCENEELLQKICNYSEYVIKLLEAGDGSKIKNIFTMLGLFATCDKEVQAAMSWFAKMATKGDSSVFRQDPEYARESILDFYQGYFGNETFVGFIETFGIAWIFERVSLFLSLPELLKGPRPLDYPIHSLIEEVVEGETSVNDWVVKHAPATYNKTLNEDLKKAESLIAYISLYDNYSTVINANFDYCDLMLWNLNANNLNLDPQIMHYLRFSEIELLQEELGETSNDIVRDIVKKVCGRHPVIAKRAISELSEYKSAKPNTEIICELMKLYEVHFLTEFMYTEMNNKYSDGKKDLEQKEKNLRAAELELKERSAVFEVKSDTINFELRQRDNKISSLESENERLKDTIRRLEKELCDEKRKNVSRVPDITETEAEKGEIDVKEEEVITPAKAVVLPPDEEIASLKVFVLGGYEKAIQSLQARFPNWTFINTDNFSASRLENADLVVFFYKAISHSLYNKCIDYCRNYNIDYQYVNVRNEEQSVAQIKQKVTEIRKKMSA